MPEPGIVGGQFHDARSGGGSRNSFDNWAKERLDRRSRWPARIGQTPKLPTLLSNRRVNEAAIWRAIARPRAPGSRVNGSILVVHDTTDSHSREATEPIGILYKSFIGKDKDGRLRHHTVCGILMHSSLALTTEGLPLGLAAIKFWTRDRFKGNNALKRSMNPTRVPIEQKESIRWQENLQQSTDLLGEPGRCVHVGDWESDIYELFCAAQECGTKFLSRTCVDRLAGDGQHTIAAAMRGEKVKATHQIEVRDDKGEVTTTTADVKYRRLRVRPPIGKQKKYPDLMLTVIHAREPGMSKGRERLDWKLITNLPVRSRKEALEKLAWYTMRWKIETFHKVLKSGCRALQTPHRGQDHEPDRGVLHPQLEDLLDDHDEPRCTGRSAGDRAHPGGNTRAGPAHRR